MYKDKAFIANVLVKEVRQYLHDIGADNHCILYYNGIQRFCNHDDPALDTYKKEINPLDYNIHAAKKHILSINTTGNFYAVLHNGWISPFYEDRERMFCEILSRYGLHYELGDSYNLTVYPENLQAYEEWEYTNCEMPIKLKDDWLEELLRQFILTENDVQYVADAITTHYGFA